LGFSLAALAVVIAALRNAADGGLLYLCVGAGLLALGVPVWAGFESRRQRA
jgi:hypothetical protein